MEQKEDSKLDWREKCLELRMLIGWDTDLCERIRFRLPSLQSVSITSQRCLLQTSMPVHV